MKIYLSKINESWIVDRVREEWYEHNQDLSTEKIKDADILWIIAPWVWQKIPKRHLKGKKVVCSYYHFDFKKFHNKEKENFYSLDKYVDEYHVISELTKKQLRTLTDKKITSIPFWVNQNIWFEISQKKELREKYNFNHDDYLIGSFQRDTEGHDLVSPKLIKGPDILLGIIQKLNEENKNLKVVLSGKRRNYIINNLQELGIPYKYFEMASLEVVNELYNLIDLYIVSSRIEGGPQAILECAASKTPILSTKVGVAPEVLHEDSIYDIGEFSKAKIHTDYAWQRVQKYFLPDGFNEFIKLFKSVTNTI
jgi:glycosyltransferase involved in cell wall biosynthesis